MRRAAIALTLLAAAALPQAGEAHSLVRPAGALISYLSQDATSLNTLTVRPDGDRIEFHDPTVDGGLDPGGCTPGAIGGGFIVQAFCPAAGVERVRLDLGEREDSAVVSVAIPATILGGPGADQLTAGPAADEVTGGEGNDTLSGGDGDDSIAGDLGSDTVDGGPGADRLLVRDGIADTVDCGQGADTVEADTLDQVAADCESVARVETAPPAGSGGDEPGPPILAVGAPTVQRPGNSRRLRVYATSSEPGAISASGFLAVAGLSRPVKTDRRRLEVGGAGIVLTYELSRARWDEVGRALQRGRRVVLRLGVVATDLSGNTSKRDAPAVRLAAGGERGASVGARPEAPSIQDHPEPGDLDGDEVLRRQRQLPDGQERQPDQHRRGPARRPRATTDAGGRPRRRRLRRRRRCRRRRRRGRQLPPRSKSRPDRHRRRRLRRSVPAGGQRHRRSHRRRRQLPQRGPRPPAEPRGHQSRTAGSRRRRQGRPVRSR